MTGRHKQTNPRLAGALFLAVAMACEPAVAQTDDAPSKDMTINLIRLLVQQKIITRKSAEALLNEAKKETSKARSASITTAPTPLPTPEARPDMPPPAAGVMRVPYVPKIVRDQIRDEVKQEVLKEAKAENWAQPETLPEWIRRIKWTGDIRVRDEQDLYGRNNIGSDGLDGFVNYAAFNANGPTDVNPAGILNSIPILNTTQNRYDQMSIRARVGLLANVSDDVLVGFRLGTGQSSNPVSTTQLLGGGFAKEDIWLDQLYISLSPDPWSTLTFGRMPDPYFKTDLLFDDNLNFDGLSLQTHTMTADQQGLGGFGALGVFPVGYTDPNFPTFSPTKRSDHTELLLGAQAGVDWAEPRYDWKFAVSMYDYLNAQGQLSSPCPIYLGTKQCSSDNTTPPFMQKGNTLFLLRDIIPDPAYPLDYAEPEFAGLSFNYTELDALAQFDLKVSPRYHLIADAEYERNLAYDPSIALRYAAEGVYPVTNYNSATRQLDSGPNAFMGSVSFGDGSPLPRKRWEWNIVSGYKYVQPDAALDAFTNNDFYMGGTNDKGYYIKASLGIYDNTWISARWFSGNQVYGAPLAIDVLQFQIEAAY